MHPPEETTSLIACRHDAVDLVLLRFGELDEERTAAVAARLATCTSCAEEYARLDMVFRLAAPDPFVPDRARAADARAAAMAEISRRSWRARMFTWNGVFDRWVASRGVAVRWVPRMALAVLLVSVGYAIGNRAPGESGAAPLADASPFDVRDIRVDPATGQFLIRYSVPEAATLSGTLGDPSVTRTLVHALGEDDDARVRLHALRALHEAAGTRAPDPELVTAVLSILSSDSGDPLRLRAVEALGSLYAGTELDDKVRRALLDVLQSGAGDGVRVAALDVLVSRPPVPSDLDRLIEVARTDENSYVRLQATDAVRRLGQAVPLESLP